MKATIIIPIFNLSGVRKRNFIRIVEYVSDSNIPTIVIEQNGKNSSKNDVLLVQQEKNKNNITFISLDVSGDLVHKSKLINEAAKHITTKYLWLLDADVFFKYEKILDLIDDQDVIKPFDAVIRLTDEETESFIENKKIAFQKGDVKPQTKAFGPLSFIIKKEIFDKEGGMDELFKGFGWEDIEFAERILDKYELTTFTSINGLHLYHPHIRDNESLNKELFIKIRGYDPEPDNAIPQYIREKTVYVETPQPKDEITFDLTGLSIVIPVKIDTHDRLSNITFCIEYLYKSFTGFELIVIEQDPQPKLDVLRKKYGFEYIQRKMSGTFHKTHNFNLAIATSKNNFIAAYDCDVFYKPISIKNALNRLIENKTKFVYPYNGYMLQLKKTLARPTDSVSINALPYVTTDTDRLPTGLEILYGHNSWDCTGGTFMFDKKEFFLSGGYNPNIISYGCEDNELETRVKMLGYRVERLRNFNCYHLEHDRSVDSNVNNFFKSNLLEFSQIKSMNENTLREYVDRGFKNLNLNVNKELLITNTKNTFSINVISKKPNVVINPKTKCSIIFTNYGTETKNTEEYINRIKAWKTKEYELIAVIHDETALHRAYLQYCKKIGIIDKLIFCVPKHGHLKGVSLGIDHASSDIVMVINSDVKVSKEIVDYCADRLLTNEKIGIIGWHYDFDANFEGTFWKDGKLEYGLRLDKPPKLEITDVIKIKTSSWYTGKVFEQINDQRILCCNGSFLSTRKTLWNKIGGMSPNLYTHSFADDYYCYGVLDLGYDIENIPKYIRMGRNKKLFECKSDDVWRGIVNPLKGIDELQYENYGVLNKEQCVIKMIIDSYDNPNVLLIGDTHEYINGIKYKKTALNNEKMDVIIITERISDIDLSKSFLSKNGSLIIIEPMYDKEFLPCGKLFVYYKNSVREEYE